VNNTNWAQSRTQVLHATSHGLAIMKGDVVTIVTNIGSPVRFESKGLDPYSLYVICSRKTQACLHIPPGRIVSRLSSELSCLQRSHGNNPDAISSILSCKQFAVGSNGSLEVGYTKGGTPVVLVPDNILDGSGLCRPAETTESNLSNGGGRGINVPVTVIFFGVLLSLIL
jgi:alpha-amylase